MDRGFCMNSQVRGAGIDESRNVFVGIENHEVDVEWKLRDLLDRSDDRRTNCNVRHKVSIHDVDMKRMGAGLLDFADVFGKRGKIGRQDRRRYSNIHWLTSRRMMSDLLKRYPA